MAFTFYGKSEALAMRRLMMGAAAAATLALGACAGDNPTGTSEDAAIANDYSLVLFGQPGIALENTMGGPMASSYDGRSGRPELPDSLKLSDAQKSAIQTLRDAFKAAHQSEIDALHAIFERARTARQAGATREEIRAILEEGRAIGEAMRPAVEALHTAILGVFTEAQRAWFAAHRPPPPRDLDGRPRRGFGPMGGHGGARRGNG